MRGQGRGERQGRQGRGGKKIRPCVLPHFPHHSLHPTPYTLHPFFTDN
ncbi:hypothetical protein [Chroococcidiopsis sp.]